MYTIFSCDFSTSIRRQKDRPKMIISWKLRTKQSKFFYFSIFFTCSYGTKGEKIEKNRSFTTNNKGFLKSLRISNPLDHKNGFFFENNFFLLIFHFVIKFLYFLVYCLDLIYVIYTCLYMEPMINLCNQSTNHLVFFFFFLEWKSTNHLVN